MRATDIRITAILSEFVSVAIMRRSLFELGAFSVLALACVVGSIELGAIWTALGSSRDLYIEDGPVETIQAFTVGFASISFAVAACRLDYELFYGAVFAALLCGLMAQREVPGCADRFFDGGFCVTNTQKDWTLVVLFAAFLAVLAIRRIPLAKRPRDLNFFWLVPVVFGCALLAVGE